MLMHHGIGIILILEKVFVILYHHNHTSVCNISSSFCFVLGYQARGVIRQKTAEPPVVKIIDRSGASLTSKAQVATSKAQVATPKPDLVDQSKKMSKESKHDKKDKKEKKDRKHKRGREEAADEESTKQQSNSITPPSKRPFNPLIQLLLSKLSDQT